MLNFDWVCSSVVERPLCMRKVQGSIPCSSKFFFFFPFFVFGLAYGEWVTFYAFYVPAVLAKWSRRLT